MTKKPTTPLYIPDAKPKPARNATTIGPQLSRAKSRAYSLRTPELYEKRRADKPSRSRSCATHTRANYIALARARIYYIDTLCTVIHECTIYPAHGYTIYTPRERLVFSGQASCPAPDTFESRNI